MHEPPIVRRAGVIGLAFGGVLLGHAVTYAGLAPGAVAREMLLAATGHGYIGAANRLGLLAVLVVLAVSILGRVIGNGTPVSKSSLTRRLMVFQVAAFVALEVAERVGSGAPLAGLAAALPVGVMIQIGVAFALAAIVRLLLRATDRATSWAASAPAGASDTLALVIRAGGSFQPVLVPATVGGRAPPRSR